ncbi:MAG TPA: FHIPEP family type III secretion protein, partial [Candidatus Xenobia bacterium]
MPKRTIYVRDEDVALFDKVAEEGSLSAVIARAVKADRGEAPAPSDTDPKTVRSEEVFTPGRFIEFSVEKEEPKEKKPVAVVELLDVDPFSVEVGKGLLSLVDPKQGAKLLERITAVRRHMAVKLGIILPGVRFRDNLKLRPNEYHLRLRDGLVATGVVELNHFLTLPKDGVLPDVPGKAAFDPVLECPALWVKPDVRPTLDEGGFMVFDPISVIASHLTQVIERNAASFLGLPETEVLLGRLRKTHAVLINAAMPDTISLVQLWRLLRMLLRERVSIRDLVVILETIL